jgi:HNH endonuclease
MSSTQLLWRRGNKATLDTLRGESRGQYDIRLGRKASVAEFFEGLSQVMDHDGTRMDLWTEPAPLPDESESPPWKLRIRRMSDKSKRRDMYIRAQRPETAHPLWRPGVGPTDETEPETDYVVLLRTASDHFYAAWLREEQLDQLPEGLRTTIGKSQVGARQLGDEEAGSVLSAFGHKVEKAAVSDDSPEGEEQPLPPLDPGEEESVQEGQPKLVQHRRRERSRSLRKKRIAQAGARPTCEACGFDFEEVYGERGSGFIECHHKIPISEIDPATPTKLKDLALLCANCHRMVHRRPWLKVEELKELLT